MPESSKFFQLLEKDIIRPFQFFQDPYDDQPTPPIPHIPKATLVSVEKLVNQGVPLNKALANSIRKETENDRTQPELASWIILSIQHA